MTTKELLALVAHLFATGYGSGHHDTVEGNYTDVFPCDLDTYFEDHDAVQEVFTALCAEVEAQNERIAQLERLGDLAELELQAKDRYIAQQDATIARMREALEACIDYGSMTDDGWVTDKARAALNQENANGT